MPRYKLKSFLNIWRHNDSNTHIPKYPHFFKLCKYVSTPLLLLYGFCHQSMRTLLNLQYLTTCTLLTLCYFYIPQKQKSTARSMKDNNDSKLNFWGNTWREKTTKGLKEPSSFLLTYEKPVQRKTLDHLLSWDTCASAA